MSEWLNRVHFGDCLETLRNMPDGIVNTCVTSPPYFGLRDYGHPGQIGLEETPEQFIGKLVEVFREVRRVLRDDGTCWVNMGDSYSSGGRDSRDTDSNNRGNAGASQPHRPGPGAGVKPKDLIGVPWMLAFALRADGWYLRQDIIWAKPNPMPESVTDRCTKSHEYIFLLSKSPRYYCDMVAIKEDGAGRDDLGRMSGHGRIGAGGGFNAPGAGPRSKRDSFKRDDSKRAGAIPGQAVGTHRADREESEWDTDRRNKRSVWIVSTKPYSGAHFATFPPDLDRTLHPGRRSSWRRGARSVYGQRHDGIRGHQTRPAVDRLRTESRLRTTAARAPCRPDAGTGVFMKTKVYIASPYTKGDVAVNVKRQLDAADQLMTLGYAPFAPLYSHFQHMAHPRPYADWIAIDLEWVPACDVLLRLDGESSGADGEVAFARERGVPVVFSMEELLQCFPANGVLMRWFGPAAPGVALPLEGRDG